MQPCGDELPPCSEKNYGRNSRWNGAQAPHWGVPWVPLTERSTKPVGLLANLLLLIVIPLLLAREYQTLETIRMRGWFGMLLLLAASLGIGWLCGGPGRATRKTLALTTASRNAAVGLVIVSNNFPDTPAVTALIAFALFSILGTLASAFALAKVHNAPADHRSEQER
jgi:predicted Na+-dependent transporter